MVEGHSNNTLHFRSGSGKVSPKHFCAFTTPILTLLEENFLFQNKTRSYQAIFIVISNAFQTKKILQTVTLWRGRGGGGAIKLPKRYHVLLEWPLTRLLILHISNITDQQFIFHFSSPIIGWNNFTSLSHFI